MKSRTLNKRQKTIIAGDWVECIEKVASNININHKYKIRQIMDIKGYFILYELFQHEGFYYSSKAFKAVI